MSKAIAYFRGVKEEFQKVVWPSRKTAALHTLLVLIVLIITTIVIALVDFGFAQLFQKTIF